MEGRYSIEDDKVLMKSLRLGCDPGEGHYGKKKGLTGDGRHERDSPDL